MIIGFNNGDLYRHEPDRLSATNFGIFKDTSCQGIELGCPDERMIDDLLAIDPGPYLTAFSWISLHAPVRAYRNDAVTLRLLGKLENLVLKFKIKNIVIHPDGISDWSAFDKFTLPISVENMDDHKTFGRTVEDIRSILDKHDFSLTLDLQHCFVNNQGMQLALDFIDTFGARIVECHVSGYEPGLLHYPLFKTHQDIILEPLKRLSCPFIIESTFDGRDEPKTELEYIQSRISC